MTAAPGHEAATSLVTVLHSVAVRLCTLVTLNMNLPARDRGRINANPKNAAPAH